MSVANQETNMQLVPFLVQSTTIDDETVRREFEPIAVTRLGGTLPWNTESTQLQCGETVMDTSGDQNIRLVYNCVATHSQFKTLQRMRATPSDIKLVSKAYRGPITFDELKFDRVTDANGAVIRGGGETSEPLYTIQLQSKEETNDVFGSS